MPGFDIEGQSRQHQPHRLRHAAGCAGRVPAGRSAFVLTPTAHNERYEDRSPLRRPRSAAKRLAGRRTKPSPRRAAWWPRTWVGEDRADRFSHAASRPDLWNVQAAIQQSDRLTAPARCENADSRARNPGTDSVAADAGRDPLRTRSTCRRRASRVRRAALSRAARR